MLMNPSFRLSPRHIIYELRGGFLLAPAAVVLLLSAVALYLCNLEAASPELRAWSDNNPWTVPREPGVSQLLLAAIAGSAMTVVSVVYSILLMALTFASIQFSPRILVSFMRDFVSQLTLGIFLGTFTYCLIVLPRIHGEPKPFVPTLAVSLALILAVLCLACLMIFIHHIAQAIQANYIIGKIASETEEVLISVFGPVLIGGPAENGDSLVPPKYGVVIPSNKSGYVQFIDEEKLVSAAYRASASIFIHRSVGQFVPEGTSLFSISPPGAVHSELPAICLSAFHIGPVRTMEDDVEFGILQMVDIALKAISPAVNDPSTAINCIDQLTRILVRAAKLAPPEVHVADASGVVRLTRRQTSFPRMLEIAFNQIIPYGRSDMAVSLRLLRGLEDISEATKYCPYLSCIEKLATRVADGCSSSFSAEECAELVQRLAVIRQNTAVSDAAQSLM